MFCHLRVRVVAETAIEQLARRSFRARRRSEGNRDASEGFVRAAGSHAAAEARAAAPGFSR